MLEVRGRLKDSLERTQAGLCCINPALPTTRRQWGTRWGWDRRPVDRQL